MKTVIVTGGSGGMGKSVCEKLAKNGYRVFALDIAHNTESNPSQNVIPVFCDITDGKSLTAAKEKISAATREIYAVISLAGIFVMDSVALGDEEKFRRIFEVNFWGVYRVNRMFMDMIVPRGKIVVMTSEVARYSPHPFDGYYAIPKKTLDSYCDALRRECRFLNIGVIKIQAGSFATNFTKKAAEEFKALKKNADEFQDVLNVFSRFVGKELNNGKNVNIIAELILKILSRKNSKILYRVKNSFKLQLINALPEKTQDELYLFAMKLLSGRGKKDG